MGIMLFRYADVIYFLILNVDVNLITGSILQHIDHCWIHVLMK